MLADEPQTYVLDGLLVSTSLEVPGARVVEDPPDWRIDIRRGGQPFDDATTEWTGDVSEDGEVWGRFGTRDGAMHVRLEDVGEMLASPEAGTAEIRVHPNARDELTAFRRLMPYLSASGGRTVVHAACAVLEVGAVLFVAEARTGKSTLALALDAAGVAVLADDHVALDPAGDGFVAHASFPFIDVAAPSREFLRPETGDHAGKISVGLRTEQPDAPVPVGALAFLRRGSELSIVPMGAAEATTRLLVEAMFAADLLEGMGHAVRLDGALALTEAVPSCTLTVPEGLKRLAGCAAELRSAPF